MLGGSAAWQLVGSGRTVNVERVTGYDMWPPGGGSTPGPLAVGATARPGPGRAGGPGFSSHLET